MTGKSFDFSFSYILRNIRKQKLDFYVRTKNVIFFNDLPFLKRTYTNIFIFFFINKYLFFSFVYLYKHVSWISKSRNNCYQKGVLFTNIYIINQYNYITKVHSRIFTELLTWVKVYFCDQILQFDSFFVESFLTACKLSLKTICKLWKIVLVEAVETCFTSNNKCTQMFTCLHVIKEIKNILNLSLWRLKLEYLHIVFTSVLYTWTAFYKSFEKIRKKKQLNVESILKIFIWSYLT